IAVGTGGTADITTTGAGSNVTQSASGTLQAGILTSTGGISGDLILQGTSNQIGTISGLTVTGGLTVVDGGPLVLAGVVGAGTADLTAQSVSQGAAGTLIAGVLTSTGGISGDAVLQGTANQIG